MTAWLRIAGLGIAMLASAAAAVRDGELPDWKEGERRDPAAAGWVAGETLLTEELIPHEPGEESEIPVPPELLQPVPTEIAESGETPAQVPEKFWPAYFDERPKSFLTDPQGTLGPVDFRERLEFLNYHAGDSSIDLFVYLFEGEQDIPGELREEELVERFFSEGRPAVVVYYFMGAPQRSVIHLSPSLTDLVPVAEQRRAVESSVMQALKNHSDPAGQFEAFLVQMSIRIYWMERIIGGGDEESGEAPLAARVAKPVEVEAGAMARLQAFLVDARRYLELAAMLVGTALVALTMAVWMKRRARHRFPDFEVEPRLGGAHAAGVGAVISFASAAVPPASQRDQMPDYLRRA